MNKIVTALMCAFFALAFLSEPAAARPRHHHGANQHYSHRAHHHRHHRWRHYRHHRHWSGSYVRQSYGLGYRPRAWCGWYLRGLKGGGPEFNLARNWAYRGSRAFGPAAGVVAVWWHHVGLIEGYAGNGLWYVHSGNDGGAVRTRARSLRGVIAFRYV